MSSMIEPSESDKRSIYKHPLFPLMALLFERCEQVTQTPDCPLVTNLKVDIQSFVHHHQQRLVDFEQSIGERPEVDSLMIKAIQILWIHLLELDKVNELCKDFCTRYISCLRTKLQNEQLLHIDAFESDSNDVMMTSSQSSESSFNRINNTGSIAYGDIRVPPQHQQHSSSRENIGMDSNLRRSAPREVDHRSQHQTMPDDSFYRHKSNKGDDLQASLQMYPPPHNYPSSDQQQQQQPQQHPDALLMQQANASLPVGGSRMGAVSPTLLASLDALDDGDYDQKTKTKRGILPKQATRVLKTWLFQHLLHPYPSEEEKKTLAEHTNLNILQVNNWFINARRRILQPVVDLNNQDGAPKAKKMKTNNNNGGNGYPGSYSPERQGGSKGRSDSRSETSTPTSTTFDCDRNSLSEYSTKQQDDDEEDNHDEDTNDDPQDVQQDAMKSFRYDVATNDRHGNNHESSPPRCQDNSGDEGGYHSKPSRGSKEC